MSASNPENNSLSYLKNLTQSEKSSFRQTIFNNRIKHRWLSEIQSVFCASVQLQLQTFNAMSVNPIKSVSESTIKNVHWGNAVLKMYTGDPVQRAIIHCT